jgi:transposase
LGIDEILACKVYKQYILIISDLERRCVIAVLPSRLQAVFARWVDSLSDSQRKSIKVVSMDMWEPYRQVVKKKLRHAQIVADRFHVMKNLNHQLDLLRRKMQRDADESLGKILKGSRWILLKNRSELSADEEDKLQHILKASEELRSVYLLKEEFRILCDKINTKERAERFLRAWLYKAQTTDSRYLIKFSKTLLNWWSEFLNYFEDRVTQGFVEGVNRAIRGIINRAFGFRNFDNLRLQILVEHGNT